MNSDNPSPDPEMEILISEWKLLLTKLLHWSEAEALAWTVRQTERMHPRCKWVFFHETPQYFILPLLIPRQLGERLSLKDYNMLTAMLDGAIRGSGTPPFTDPRYDWNAAKARIAVILARYQS